MQQRHELSKQLQDLHINVALFTETYLKPHRSFFISDYHFCCNDSLPAAVEVRKGIPHNHIKLSPLFQ
jgi:hypothetical protein